MFTTNTTMEVRFYAACFFNCHLDECTNTILVECLKRIIFKNIA